MRSIITTITIILFIGLQVSVYGQSEKFEYAHVSIGFKLNGAQIQMISKDNTPTSGTDFSVKDENGKKLKFKTYIEALNYLGEQGWEIIQTLENVKGMSIMSTAGYAYLMKRKKG